MRIPALAFAVATIAAPAALLADRSSSEGCRFTAHLTGADEIPARDTLAQGRLHVQVSVDQTEVAYKLTVAKIDNVVAAHLHLAPAGSNGPIVAFLAGPFAAGGGPSNGVLAEGTLTAASLIGPLSGRPLSDLVDQMASGNIYANVHTDDGVPPPDEGPGDFPGGEIRGQLRPIGHECVRQLRYFTTCGDPVCGAYRPDPTVPDCTNQVEGAPCAEEGDFCQIVGDTCNVRLLCASEDPKLQGCPISQRKAKTDVRYLGPEEVTRLRDTLVRLPLASWRYKAEEPGAPERLGFVIDDVGPGPAVLPNGRQVDLYGYTSMAVAGLQAQERELEALRREVADLRGKMEVLRTRGRRSKR
jgi:hypothetical protein